jgi:threonyl-tRNA synthetase
MRAKRRKWAPSPVRYARLMSAGPETSTSSQISVTLAGGPTVTVPAGSTSADLVRLTSTAGASHVVAAVVNGEEVDLARSLPDGALVALVADSSAEGRRILRHSAAHILAQAVLSLWPGARFAIGPPIEDGFYYDFELPGGARFTEEDLGRIEDKMREIVARDQPFMREEHSIEAGLALFANQPYKIEIIEQVESEGPAAASKEPQARPGGPDASEELSAAGTSEASPGGPADSEGVSAAGITAYRNSETFVDLCRGPHIPSTGRLRAFKLTRLAGAYWRGDERRPQLQRVYGTAWESEGALKDYLRRLEEAERRDHRRLGAELDLFSFPDEVGSGLPVFHPKGALVRVLMEDYSRRRHLAGGYQFVSSPHIAKAELFETSGHLQWFSEAMFPPMELDGAHRYYLKPMNCPFHILAYRSRQRSYRELPMRLFELGTVYRYEKSGVVHGLTRVRGMTQDDAHIFCRRDQMAGELESLLGFVLDVLRDFGLEDFYLELSTKPEGKAVGTDAEWDEATEVLRAVGEARGRKLLLDEGGGAFYGPKLSVQVKDAIGRAWQMSTIQLDFQEPHRFELAYVGADNARHRPIMIHRALFGSVERFLGVLLEHYAGALPTWLAPVQARVLPVADDHLGYAERVAAALEAHGCRAEVEPAGETLQARVRRAKLDKLPYVVVVGAHDTASETVGVTPRGQDRPERAVPLGRFVERLAAEASPPDRSAALLP